MLQLTPCRTSAYSMLGFWFRHAICLKIIQLVWYNPDLRTLQSHTTISVSLWHHPTRPWRNSWCTEAPWWHPASEKISLGIKVLPDTPSSPGDQKHRLPGRHCLQGFRSGKGPPNPDLPGPSHPRLEEPAPPRPPRGNSDDLTDGDVPYSRPVQYLNLPL